MFSEFLYLAKIVTGPSLIEIQSPYRLKDPSLTEFNSTVGRAGKMFLDLYGLIALSEVVRDRRKDFTTSSYLSSEKDHLR